MRTTQPDLAELAELNPVPLAAVSGQSRGNWAEALMHQIMQSTTAEPRADAARRSAVRVIAVVGLASLSVAGIAIGARMVTDNDVEASLPAGSTLFAGAQPDCHLVEAGTEYRCHLARTPTGMRVVGADGKPAFLGAKFATVGDTQHINGGCIALNHAGTEWACYIGDAAVTKDIIDKDVLGQLQTAPAAG